MKEYLSNEQNIIFDFTMDNDCECYKKIDNPIERYFVYRSLKESIKKSCYSEASNFAEKNIQNYKQVKDPDLSSKLLQQIYSLLWPDLCSKKFMISDDEWIQSDTMTSAQRTFNLSVEKIIENKEELEDRKKGRKRVSDAYCIELYARNKESFTKRIMNVPGEESFLRLYHTIGNYVPVPKQFNAARSGQFASHDYWDLTLMKIHEYYQTCEQTYKQICIEELLHGKGDLAACKAWLDYFGVGEEGWKTFIKSYLFQDYVDNNYDVIPFCRDHSWDKPDISDCVEFFLNISRLIYLRGKRMFTECKKFESLKF